MANPSKVDIQEDVPLHIAAASSMPRLRCQHPIVAGLTAGLRPDPATTLRVTPARNEGRFAMGLQGKRTRACSLHAITLKPKSSTGSPVLIPSGTALAAVDWMSAKPSDAEMLYQIWDTMEL
ncbi:uncharacterized protein PAC_04737 [Phialocephala subalpina]|uniref:Uncharacterized protein n=1 Tax=Phialocephala subalpina TaxID=576137 RepID=A0A1L7WQ15_9HELO|nr:uncharacterized protein PAC_04737 [Phialocephala subalpina]